MEDKKLFHKLKRRLITAYTVTAGAILTFVVMVAFFYTVDKEKEQDMRQFQNNAFIVSNQIKSTTKINDYWISEQQEKNHLIIYVEDGGEPLLMPSTADFEKRRKKLVKQVKALAEKEKVDIGVRPISEKELSSSVFRISDQNGRDYLGQASVFSAEHGYIGLIVLQQLEEKAKKQVERLLLFLVSALLGIIALFFVGSYFIGSSLKPVEEGKRQQSEFITAASHELRSPLAVIKANLGAMQKEAKNREECMEVMNRECDRMAVLIEDLLALSHADSGRRKITKSRFDAESLVFELYENYETIMQEKKLDFSISLPEKELPQLLAEEARIRQILCIFIENAIRFSDPGSGILLRAYRKGKYRKLLVMEVEDHGCGVPGEERKKIFERFYQTDKARGEKEHFGLGLSLAKEFAFENSGTVSCRETPGGGATFVLELAIH